MPKELSLGHRDLGKAEEELKKYNKTKGHENCYLDSRDGFWIIMCEAVKEAAKDKKQPKKDI